MTTQQQRELYNRVHTPLTNMTLNWLRTCKVKPPTGLEVDALVTAMFNRIMEEIEPMAPSEKCFALVKKWESYRAEAYLCSGGVWTLGWGHTIKIKPGDTCTFEQALTWLEEDVGCAAGIVRSAVKVPLSQGQLDALTSFVFNVGPGGKGIKDGFVTLKSGQASTMLRKLNAGDSRGAAEEFGKWIYGGGRKLNGLVARRREERELFQS